MENKKRIAGTIDARSWRRGGRWAIAATLLLLTAGWPTAAQAATPSWWDCDYGYRKKLTVSATAAVPVDYSATLTFDHAALVSAGKSEADGDDIRIVYWNGAGWEELDRFLDPNSNWNTGTTKLWFKLKAAISSSSSDGNYYLHYGNTSAVNPPDIPQNVFFFYDGYESGDFSAWGNVEAGAGDSNTVGPECVEGRVERACPEFVEWALDARLSTMSHHSTLNSRLPSLSRNKTPMVYGSLKLQIVTGTMAWYEACLQNSPL